MGFNDGSPTIEGGSDGTIIGNTGDSLKVIVTNSSLTVAGTVAATQSGTWNITNITGTISLPTGAATEAKQDTGNSSLASIDSKLTTTNSSLAAIDSGIPAALGQTTMSASMPVAIASNQSAIPASQSGSWAVSVNNGAAAAAVNIQDGGNVITVDSAQLPSALVGGRLDVNVGAWLGATTPTVGQKVMAASIPVTISSDQNLIATLAEQQTQTTALQLIDDTVHAANAAFNKALAIGGQLDDTSPTAATENNVSVARITAQRALHVNLRDNGGTQIGDITTPVVTLSKFQAGYVSGSVSVGTSAVEAKVGGSRVATRKVLYIENTGTTDIYYGPATVTTANGAILRRRQFVFLSAGNITVQVISSAVGGSVIVQEMS